MPLVYRSVFRDADGRIAETLGNEFTRWLAEKSLRLPEKGISQRGSALDSDDDSIAWAAELESTLPNGDRIHRFRLVEELPDARWITTVAAVRQAADDGTSGSELSRIWIDLEHEPTKRSAPVQPGSPRIVRELLAVGEGYDGPVPLTSEALSLMPNHVAEVVEYIVSAERSVPVIVFAHDSTRAYDQRKLMGLLARDLAGVAAVFSLSDSAANERLASSLPEGYAVYGGAMRTYLPGAVSEEDDVSTRHRILGRASLVALGRRAFPAVKNQILELSTQRPAPVALRASGGASLPPAPEKRPAIATAPSLGVAWLRERVARIRNVLGVKAQEPANEDEAAAFDLALEELLARAAATPSPSQEVQPASPDLELLSRLQTETDERLALEELLNEAQEDIEQRAARAKAGETAYDDLTIEAIEAAADVDRLGRRVRWLERRVRDLGDAGLGTDDELPEAPDSVAEVVELARLYLSAVELGDIEEEAAALDLHAQAPLYASKSWAALQALDAYARVRGCGEFNGSFYAWCQSPPPGEPAVSAAAVAMGESETVDSSPDLRAPRTFPVPVSVHASGHCYMPAHIKVVKRVRPHRGCISTMTSPIVARSTSAIWGLTCRPRVSHDA